MSEEFKCVFGYGSCPVREMIAQQRKEYEALSKASPTPTLTAPVGSPEAMRSMMGVMMPIFSSMMQVMGDLPLLAVFCIACVKRKVEEAKALKKAGLK
ncbi:MAG: hypothetical protein ACETV1_04875 [Candidatus Bathyarchaeia archaeon]